jgi:hypothetical protein
MTINVKTPKLAPLINDKPTREFLQFMRDDVQKIVDNIQSNVKINTQTITVTSGTEFSLGKCLGAILITQPVVLNNYITRKDENGQFFITMDFDSTNTGKYEFQNTEDFAFLRIEG